MLYNISITVHIIYFHITQRPHSPSSTKVSATIDWLSNALRSLAIFQEQNNCVLYGNCYVMSTDKEKGITWQLQTGQLAAIELSQRTKLVADRLDKELFEKVSVAIHYVVSFGS